MHDREDASVGLLRSFGRQVKLFREQRGLTQAELGSLVKYSPDQVASIEQGRRIAKPELIEALDGELRAGGVLLAMKDEVKRARYPVFFQEFAAKEAEAVQLHSYDTMCVNGLLQTEDYARAVFHMRRPKLSEEIVEQRVAARLDRQRLFDRRPEPLFSFVFEEAVLRRPLGGRHVLRSQLEHLLTMGQRSNIDIQIMPTDQEEWAGVAGPLILLETETERLAYVEVQTVSRLIADRNTVRQLENEYGTIRAQALNPHESRGLIKRWLVEG